MVFKRWRYTSDGTGNIRYINDQERKSTHEFENAEKSVYKLEQLLKIGSKDEIKSFLDEILSGKTREGIDYTYHSDSSQRFSKLRLSQFVTQLVISGNQFVLNLQVSIIACTHVILYRNYMLFSNHYVTKQRQVLHMLFRQIRIVVRIGNEFFCFFS